MFIFTLWLLSTLVIVDITQHANAPQLEKEVQIKQADDVSRICPPNRKPPCLLDR
jgi:hypothetical protein